MSASQKRFIAGAKCPQCGALDCVVVYRRDGEDFRECVDCGFVEKWMFQAQMRELDTRVNQSREEREAERQVLHLDPVLKDST